MKSLDLNISICSYNLYWKIMKNKSSPLQKQLGKKKINNLKKNILQNISNIIIYYNPFFYCFQEAENYMDIISLFDTNIFKYHVGYSQPEHIVTVWNLTLFEVKYIIDADFEPGRPFTILIINDLRFNKYFMLINLHAGHYNNTIETIFKPIQKNIDIHKNKILKFNINRIIMIGDFNREINKIISIKPLNFFLTINNKKIFFIPHINNNKTCCNINGRDYYYNFDQIIDSYCQPILIYPLNTEKWYISESSDHLMILSIIKNFI